jgi:hypothetical protein
MNEASHGGNFAKLTSFCFAIFTLNLTVTRTKDDRRYLPVHDICHIQGPLVCKLLPAVHALTGCDTTSTNPVQVSEFVNVVL